MSKFGKVIGNVPLLVIPFAIYNVAVLYLGNAQDIGPKNANDYLSLGNIITLMSIGLLYVEIFKSTRTGASSIIDHLFSMAVFVAALIEFIMLPDYRSVALFTLMMVMFVDIVGGFTITIRGARRDFGAGGGGIPMS